LLTKVHSNADSWPHVMTNALQVKCSQMCMVPPTWSGFSHQTHTHLTHTTYPHILTKKTCVGKGIVSQPQGLVAWLVILTFSVSLVEDKSL